MTTLLGGEKFKAVAADHHVQISPYADNGPPVRCAALLLGRHAARPNKRA